MSGFREAILRDSPSLKMDKRGNSSYFEKHFRIISSDI